MPRSSRHLPDTPHPSPTHAPLDELILDVGDDLVGQRLDRALAATLPGMSRTRAQVAIEAGRVTVDGHPVKSSLLLEPGMRIAVAPDPDAGTARAIDVGSAVPATPLRVVYEDAHLLVVDKPAGVVVHPAPGHPDGTLVDALLAHLPGLDTTDDPTRPGIVHRLDKDTSGLLVIAKDAPTHTALAEQIAQHRMIKRYLALVEGQMSTQEGVVEAPIGRDPRNRQRMAVVTLAAGGREARTRFRVLRTHRGRTLLELQLETGRTHQIRVHLAAVHHPVVGDSVYSRPQPPQPPRQFLHAAHLEFSHPVTGAWLTFDAPLPSDLAGFLSQWDR
jgi:23S rRNA pseudouridine1911/1915/1917 synthase